MIDLYLHAPTREALLADLLPLGLAVDGELVTASHDHALMEIPISGGTGVTVALRCVGETLTVAVLGTKFPNGTKIVSRPENAPAPAGGASESLETAKAAACAAIDAEAERRRLMVLTPGQGQAMEYQHTAEEAARAVAAPDPLDPAAYPFLAAEQEALLATIGEVGLRDVAVAVLTDRAAWMAYGAAIKAVRRRAKLQIREAADVAAVAAVELGIEWPEKP
ncbi:hypothetical protein G3N56_08415 [Desulfovibrio sulfodismutans]|uniref:Uncharacterized protein n=1 Tax=Desulfolutivibrio sulfodismutans TaxID=63561 RepID=A0A7K3NKP0_9BACT|nr:hypothetical protein [Desulfolutivibrio sulfodismutans]NDY56766.1 hypothetical protein [Desulfolutivibrio sulfodismutans]QLA13310.1 hypothetical protein GD606_14085 [Desulfolutivibrio sulfodismutans DSM 3696]